MVMQSATALAIVKTKVHLTGNTVEIRGNALADRHAKLAAQSQSRRPFLMSNTVHFYTSALLPGVDFVLMQSHATPEDSYYSQAQGADPDDHGIWFDKVGHLCIPIASAPFLIREFHGVSHHSLSEVLSDMISKFCIRDLRTQIKTHLSRCLICLQNNATGSAVKHNPLPPPQMPFECLQVDFTHMPTVGPHRMLLVIVDRFSKWVEAFPWENAKNNRQDFC